MSMAPLVSRLPRALLDRRIMDLIGPIGVIGGC